MTDKELLAEELAQMTDEELAQLSPEELAEIEALLASEEEMPAELTETATAGVAPQVNVEPGQIADIEDGMDLAGQAAGQFLSASQAVPGVKQISAATELVTKAVQNPEDFAFDNIADHYSDIRKNQEALYEKAKKDNPWINTGAEIGTGIVGFGALGKLGMATKGLKSAVTTTPTLTAIQAYTRDSDVNMSELIKEAGVASLFDTFLFSSGKAFTAVGKTLKATAEATPIEAIAFQKTSIQNIVKHIRKTADKVEGGTAAEKVKAYRASLKRFTNNLFKGDVPVVEAALDPSEMLERSVIRQDEVGEKIAKTLSKIDNNVSDLVDIREVERKLERDVIDGLLTSDSSTKNKLGKSLSVRLKEDLYETTEQITEKVVGSKTLPSGAVEPVVETVKNITRVPKKMSLTRLHTYFKDVSKEASFNPSADTQDKINAAAQYTKISGSLSGFIEDLVDRAGPKINNPDILSEFQTHKLEYRDLIQVSEALEKTATNSNASKGVGALMSDIVSLKGITTAAAVGATISEKTMIAPMAGMINALRSSKTMPSTLAVASRKVADFLEAASMSPKAQQMVRQLSAAATISAVDFEKELTAQAAKADLLEQPLPRSVEAVIERSGPIRVLLNDIDPTVAADFEEILETGDEEQIAAYMNEIAALPEAQGLIEDGIGFNGKLYSPAEKEMMVNKVKSQRSLSRLDRLKIQKQIMEEGYIPSDEELEDRRQPKQWAPRDKNKLRY
jgi:hypothetical protein